MNLDFYKKNVVMFLSMIIVGMFFNPMNALAYRLSDIYVSHTLFLGGVLMASNMIWSHEIIHLINMGKMSPNMLLLGVCLSLFTVLLLRTQFLVTDNQWLKRMISHHSTALTTSHQIFNKSKNTKLKRLAKSIIQTQEREISLMKSMLK